MATDGEVATRIPYSFFLGQGLPEIKLSDCCGELRVAAGGSPLV
jgi:hypothetical protein